MSAIEVSSGESHTCAVLTDNRVKCWGLNINGQLGDGTNTDRHSPAYSSLGGTGVLKISAGSYHTCAITVERNVMCWGENWNGQ